MKLKINVCIESPVFLVDTEASVSLLKIGTISNEISYDKTDIVKLVGISQNPIFSLGSCNVKIIEQTVEFEHKFHIVPDDFFIPSNGIIGKDFLKRFKCLIDYGAMTLQICKTNAPIVIIEIKSEVLPGVSVIPPRCETFRIFHIKSESFPCVIESQEIADAIVVPTTIVHEPIAC